MSEISNLKIKKLLDKLYYDRLENRNLDPALNELFECFLNKYIHADSVPSLHDIHKS